MDKIKFLEKKNLINQKLISDLRSTSKTILNKQIDEPALSYEKSGTHFLFIMYFDFQKF